LIVLDEAGFARVEDMYRLFEFAKQARARVLICGDPGQNSGVAAGDALAILLKRSEIAKAKVTEIVLPIIRSA
jgi:hypothetical protein